MKAEKPDCPVDSQVQDVLEGVNSGVFARSASSKVKICAFNKIVLILFGMACVPSKQPEGFKLPLPTKDQVALVNGRPLTLSDYHYVRSLVPQLAPQTVFWIGTAALALQIEAHTSGVSLSSTQALEISRYSMGSLAVETAMPSLRAFYSTRPIPSPNEVKRELEALLARSVVLKSTVDLTTL